MVKGEALTLPNVPEMVLKEGQAPNLSLHPDTHSAVFGELSVGMVVTFLPFLQGVC